MNTLIVILVVVVIVSFIIWKFIIRKDEEEDEEIVPKKYNLPPLSDFASKDPQTGQMRMDFSFDPSETDIGEYLVLDIETTGLPKVRDAKPEELDYMPRIVQISWYLLDSFFKCVNVENCYLKQDAPIPTDAIKIHGITDAIIEEKGEDPKSVLEKLNLDIRKANYIVAHNVEFDLPIIESEYIRFGMKKPFRGKKKICTMKEGKKFCKIPRYSGGGYKYPKLEELLEHCYFPGWSNIRITEAHNAKVDAAITIICFIKLKELGYFKIE
jgi:DNA polymerase III epsilon subunit-like protein